VGVTYYSSEIDKKRKSQEINKHGFSIIHCDFVDKKGKPTSGKSGRLIYGTEQDRNSIEKQFTTPSGDYFSEFESVKTFVEVFPLMYEVYDRTLSTQLADKLGLDVKNMTSGEILSSYHHKLSQKLQYLNSEQKRDFVPDDVDKLMMTVSKNKMFLPRSKEFVNEMALIYLVAIFQAYVTEILQVVFKFNDSLLKSAETNFDYTELKNHDNEALLKKLSRAYTKEIVNRGTKNLSKQLKIIFDFKLPSNNWKEFSERFARRNILVHNNGISNQEYKSKYPEHSTLDKLEVSQDYLSKSFKLFSQYEMQINNFFWKKYGEPVYLEQMKTNNVINNFDP